ncbi:MAG TPA: integrase core domain-containing protein [Bellilinea sp.]|nr:integrase core domain-containing protein [Bellilinea sp.]
MPMPNGYVEAFNGLSGDEPLNKALFHAPAVIREWMVNYNTCRPRSSIGS